jgi:hypothetical protein
MARPWPLFAPPRFAFASKKHRYCIPPALRRPPRDYPFSMAATFFVSSNQTGQMGVHATRPAANKDAALIG